MQSETFNQLKQLHDSNFDLLTDACMKKAKYEKKLRAVNNKGNYHFMFYARKIDDLVIIVKNCFDKHNEIIEKAQLLQAVND
jgi:hypothetical protein